MQPCWAVLAGFGGDLEAPVDGAFVVDSPLSWVARNSSKPDRPTAESWVLHAGPEWSRAHLDLEGEAVTQRLLAALEEALGRPLPAPAYVAAHRWRYASPDPALEERCLFDPDERVGAAGDWCGGPRVEGAFLSGAALARALLERT
jgi:predicted NAD/FAD-dependent oxidoreductase